MTNIEIHFLDNVVPGSVSPGPGNGVGRVVALRGADGSPPVALRRRVVHQGVGVAGVTPPQPRPRRHVAVPGRASNKGSRRFQITEKGLTRAFSWLKTFTSAFTFKTLC